MLTRYIFTSSQRLIFLFSFFITLFFNQTFFAKLFQFAWAEQNYTVLLSAPLVLILLFMAILNIVLALTHRYTFKSVMIFLLFLSASTSYFIDSFGTIIDKNMITNMIQTDSAEVFDLMTPKLLFYLLIGAILPSLLLHRTRVDFDSYRFEVIQKCLMAILLVGISIALYMGLSKVYSSFFRNHHELKMYLNPYYPITSSIKFITVNMKEKKVLAPIGLDAIKPMDEPKKLMILVVGETARAENFSLNGYRTQTNPLLQSRQDIVNFPNFYSCGTATALSIPCMFSKFSREEFNDDKYAYENLIDVAQRAGVRVIWRDNNSGGSKGIADRVKDSRYYGGKEFDEILLQGLHESIEQTHEDTLIVLHQEGSHGPTYYKRYPDNFKKFTPTCDTQDLEKCSKEQIVNTYDNTILYTDFVINEAIKLLEKNEKNYQTSLFYVSDHGESLGENGVYLHGIPYFIAPDAQKHVPALFYLGNGNENLKKLIAKKSEPLSHDNLFHTILGIFKVQTSEYNAKLDINAL